MKKALLTYFIGLSLGLFAQENPIISGCLTNFPETPNQRAQGVLVSEKYLAKDDSHRG